ncbi:putative glutathione S-transferase [Caenibius tardaugens NBRC 16725]|uniref:Putative glutathione S-transferase n=1 Tax=Caenibius tardaugens NBRC 16725 TaxID=1219035 RepID=U2YJ17_9SPHN|nr:glutathione S-transferase family protein [Caenibius tardaugens]AZI34653.1 glutathione S-transferase family protein [Caenibius tardaugens NBRC 16725]GAD48162.1 putative glutathione S-transferase [Caenibius tardaugens NBRC 16725]
MPVNDHAPVQITAYNWVPDFARGFVRDLRPRWACEEIGIDYSERLFNPAAPRPDAYYAEQPWGQVPVVHEDGLEIFESGATLIHFGEKDERLLPRDPQARMRAISWLFAALNTIEPSMMELSTVDIFAKDEEWAKLRRPGLIRFIAQRLDRLSDALGESTWFAGDFSIADIAMTTVLRQAQHTDLISARPRLDAYVARASARPAFARAMAAQLAALGDTPEPAVA